jgi:rhodanese-related sulfurtransferase
MAGEEDKERKDLGSPILRDLPEDKLSEIAGAVEKKVLPAGTMIFQQGDPGDSFFIINAGKVRVFRRDSDGIETNLSQLGAGTSFGEMALLTGEPRSANVETLEETRLTVLTKDQFDRVLRDFPGVSLAFVKQMSTWLLRDEQKLELEAQRQYRPPSLSLFDFVLLGGITLLCALVFNSANPNKIPLFPKSFSNEAMTKVPPSSAMEAFESGETLFIDAMPANFFEKRHIEGAVNMPLSIFDIMYMMVLTEESKDKKIIVYGRTISKRYDQEVANKLALRGHKNISILEGGLSAWEKKGYPVEQEESES